MKKGSGYMEKLIYNTLVTTAQKGSLIKVLGGIFAAGAFTGLVVTKACGNAMVKRHIRKQEEADKDLKIVEVK